MTKELKHKQEDKPEEAVLVITPPREETFEERQARERREEFIKKNDEARKIRQEILKRNNLPAEPVRELTEEEIQKRCCS